MSSAEEALMVVEERIPSWVERPFALFESIVVHANDVVLVTEAEPLDLVDGGPKVLYVNPAFTRMTGYEADEIIGLTPRILQSPKTDRAELDRLRSALKRWEAVEVELLNVKKDGTEFWVQINITPVANDSGWWTHWVAIQRDISARKLRDQAIEGMLSSTSDLIVIVDVYGLIVGASPSAQRFLGREALDLVGRPMSELVEPSDVRRLDTLLAPSPGVRVGSHAHAQLRLTHDNGLALWVEVTAADLELDHEVMIVMSCVDVSSQVQAETDLRIVNDRFRGSFADAPIAMAVTSTSGRIIDVNAALMTLSGRDRRELLSMSLDEFVHPDERETVTWQLRSLLEDPAARCRYETRLLGPDGATVVILHSASVVTGQAGDAREIINHLENITERKSFEDRLRHRALHDNLTGLPNRALLIDRLDQALAASKRNERTIALLFLDIDRFKAVNDTFGHHIGDVVLQTLAQRLGVAIRPGDTAARLAGDEFVIVCEDTSPQRAASAANRIAGVLREPFAVARTGISVTTSIGIALSRPGVSTADSLLREADTAMYEAKEQGAGRVGVFDAALGAQLEARQQMEVDLRAGIAAGQLRLHYQPEVNLLTGALVGLEALVRWEHPRDGLIQPTEFIALAEECGLIQDLGAWVIDTALEEAARRRLKDPTSACVMWVNLSPFQIQDPTFADHIRQALARHDLPGSAVGLEITENIVMGDTALTRAMLAQLRSLGVGLAIDDFGTGYSSLSYLAQFPVDTIKIDQSFTVGLDDPSRRRESYAVVSAVVGLAHALRLRIVAEGVETASQAQALQGLGCDYGQGYLIGRPSREGRSDYDPGCAAVTSAPMPALSAGSALPARADSDAAEAVDRGEVLRPELG